MTNTPVSGQVETGFEPVKRAFEDNFAHRRELGAAVCVWVDGRPVADLWGGHTDVTCRTPWDRDTLVLVFSATKGLAAAAFAVAHSRGLIDYDAPVAAYWPEFAAAGKAGITVRQLLAHQAGLPAVGIRLSPAVISDWGQLTSALARQAPLWRPGDWHGYHAFTLGWYESELIRRSDPRGRRMPQFLYDEVTGRLGVEFYMGLPEDLDARRVATVEGWPAWRMLFHIGALPPGMVMAYLNPRSLTARTMANPRLANPADLGSPAFRCLEFPAGVGFGTARAIASIYGELATGGHRLGLSPATVAVLAQPPSPPRRGVRDLVLHTDTSFSLGWWRPFPSFPFGTPAAFGTPGAGGSFGFADPHWGLGYAYVTNRMGFRVWDDPRDLAIRDALSRCLGRRSGLQVNGPRRRHGERATGL